MMSAAALVDTLVWLPVGEGRRSHAFAPGKLFWAYCGIGPGEPLGATSGERCRSCLMRIAEHEARERELAALGS